MKRWFEPLTTAWVGVATHKMRSSLTILGIVIGVAAVIALMSIGRGAERDIISRIETLGSDLITINPGSFTFGGVRGAFGSAQTLTQQDASAISEQVSNVNLVAPFFSTNLQLVVGGENTNSRVTGITLEYMQVYNLNIASGGSISEYDYPGRARGIIHSADGN